MPKEIRGSSQAQNDELGDPPNVTTRTVTLQIHFTYCPLREAHPSATLSFFSAPLRSSVLFLLCRAGPLRFPYSAFTNTISAWKFPGNSSVNVPEFSSFFFPLSSMGISLDPVVDLSNEVWTSGSFPLP